jgi:hypothetical protein
MAESARISLDLKRAEVTLPHQALPVQRPADFTSIGVRVRFGASAAIGWNDRDGRTSVQPLINSNWSRADESSLQRKVEADGSPL